MGHILLEEKIDDAQGIFIGGRIEIQGAAEKIPGGIGDKELLGRGGIAPDVEEDAADPIGRMHGGILDRTGLIGVFECHFEGIFPQLVEAVGSYLLVADIDPCVESGKVYIDPIGVFRPGLEEAGIPDDIGVYGVFKGIGKIFLVEGLVLMGWKIDFEVPSFFGRIDLITGKEQANSASESQ